MKYSVDKKYSFIFAGGGTGGHLYPLIAVAEQVKLNLPDADILFVGTAKKIESKVIPALGYNFESVNISGFPRKINFETIKFGFKLISSIIKSLSICFKYKPDVVIGAGAYVSGPIVWAGALTGAKIVLMEQNSYPGVTNRLLEKKAEKIFISFEDSKKYFRFPDKLSLLGNPLRFNVKLSDKAEAVTSFGLDTNKKTLVVLGGSLGAGSINKAVEKFLNEFSSLDIQIIWQCGEKYFDSLKKYNSSLVKVMPFINDMGKVYSTADLIVARAGATTIAEIAYLGLPTIFVPSPNVTDDHQYKNAKSIADKNGALVIRDNEVESVLFDKVKEVIFDLNKLNNFKENIKHFAKPEAAKNIGAEVVELAKNKNRL